MCVKRVNRVNLKVSTKRLSVPKTIISLKMYNQKLFYNFKIYDRTYQIRIITAKPKFDYIKRVLAPGEQIHLINIFYVSLFIYYYLLDSNLSKSLMVRSIWSWKFISFEGDTSSFCLRILIIYVRQFRYSISAELISCTYKVHLPVGDRVKHRYSWSIR